MTNPTSNFGWQMPTSTDLVTDLPADFEVFGQAVDTSLADLKGGTTGQILSKTTNTDMDFTWITNDVGDITAVTAGTGISGGGTSGAVTVTNSMATAIDAKGDLIAGTGADAFSRLAVGTNDQVLLADSSTATGLKWGSPSSGGMTSIATGSLTGASVSITSIPGTYRNLQLVLDNVGSATGVSPNFLLNNDTGANYGTQYIRGGTGAEVNNTSNFPVNNVGLPAANNGYSIIFDLYNYANTNTRKIANYYVYKSSGGGDRQAVWGGYDATGAINRIDFRTGSGTFSSGTYTLYGVK
jgi:hypothetical protein